MRYGESDFPCSSENTLGKVPWDQSFTFRVKAYFILVFIFVAHDPPSIVSTHPRPFALSLGIFFKGYSIMVAIFLDIYLPSFTVEDKVSIFST